MKTPLTFLIASALLAPGLQAQVIKHISHTPDPLQTFQQELQEGPAMLLVLDDPGGTWSTLAREALQQEGAVDLRIQLKAMAGEGSDPVTAHLRTRHGWPEGPRWAVLASNGTLKATGITRLSPQDLAARLLTLGLPNPLKAAEAFARAHPERLDAAEILLAKHYARATRRMAPYLKPPPRTSFQVAVLGGETAILDRARELDHPLPPAEDLRLWGESARLLKIHLATRPWFSASPGDLAPPQGAEHSPLMRDTCRLLLPRVEAELERAPSHNGLWRLWLGLARCAGNTSLRALVPRLVYPTGQGIPLHAKTLLVQELKRAKAWAELRDLLLPIIQNDQDEAEQHSMAFMGFGNMTDLFKGIWDQGLGPLVEALLRLDEDGTADQLVRRAITQHGSASFPIWASQVALQCGKGALARQWAELQVPAKEKS